VNGGGGLTTERNRFEVSQYARDAFPRTSFVVTTVNAQAVSLSSTMIRRSAPMLGDGTYSQTRLRRQSTPSTAATPWQLVILLDVGRHGRAPKWPVGFETNTPDERSVRRRHRPVDHHRYTRGDHAR
jgi:hypothetical protein